MRGMALRRYAGGPLRTVTSWCDQNIVRSARRWSAGGVRRRLPARAAGGSVVIVGFAALRVLVLEGGARDDCVESRRVRKDVAHQSSHDGIVIREPALLSRTRKGRGMCWGRSGTVAAWPFQTASDWACQIAELAWIFGGSAPFRLGQRMETR